MLLATVLLAALPGAAQAAPACGAPHSWVGGTTSLCRGMVVYGDYVDDDYGADAGAADTTARTALLAPSAGDQRYPGGQDATADLIRLTIAKRGDRLVVTALLNALHVPDSTVLAIAIDRDDDPATGGGTWGPLPVRSAGWDDLALFDRGDPATNTITGTMRAPASAHWRVQAVAANRASGRVMNVAFRGPAEHARWTLRTLGVSDAGTWFEDDQAAALRTGDISRFGYRVSAADLRRRVTRSPLDGPGLQERVYESAYAVGPQNEGVSVKGVPGRGDGGPNVQSFQYLGRFQPYGVYVPDTPGLHGVQLVLHGSNSSLAGLINQPGMQRRFGRELDRILVVPEARGSEGFGSDISERDVLDVMADVRRSYPVDPARVFAGGYSQGGYIADRMAALYPDRFAGLVTWVGYTGNLLAGTPLQAAGLTGGAVGNVLDLLGNLRHVPSVMLYAGADELVPVPGADAMDRALAATDDVYRYYLHPLADHLTFALLDDWAKEAEATRDLRLVRDPPRVTYRTATVLDDPAHGIVHDRAYWVSRIRPRGAGYADVDLTSSACGGTVPRMTRRTTTGVTPVLWVGDEHRADGAIALTRRDALVGTLRNVASARVAVGPTCLARRAVAYRLVTDGPAAIVLGDGRALRFSDAGTHTGTLPLRQPKGRP